MEIYKQLENLGFFKWYCTQYGGLVYQEYKTVYDDLPLDNIIRTELKEIPFLLSLPRRVVEILLIKFKIF
jgi:hypothetical protein